MIKRTLQDRLKTSSKSFLLLGPRQTGKSTLIRSLEPDLSINLANEQTYLEFAHNPSELVQRLAAKKYQHVFIDEVQRLPSLLNTVQVILDEGKQTPQFYLTGSSARKLKRGRANLLPGRIHSYQLSPLSAQELGYELDQYQALATGCLPGIYLDKNTHDREKTLRTYAATYLKEEIQAEALTRNLEGFSRFLFVAAQLSGSFVDFAKLSNEASISRQSAIRYFEILQDTLIVHSCPPFARSARKRLVQHPKFFFFDTGVLNALLGNFQASDDRKGMLFEHLFFNQLISSAQHQDQEICVSTYRTNHGAEVDFIVEYQKKVWAIELKSSANIGMKDLRGLQSFSEFYNKPHEKVVAHLGKTTKKMGSTLLLPWQELLQKMKL